MIRYATLLSLTMVGAWLGYGSAAPTIFWASDPIRPGETAMVIGEGFGKQPMIEVARLNDTKATKPSTKPFTWPNNGQKVEALQSGDSSLKFVLPESLKTGVFSYRVSGTEGAATGLLNRPTVWWAQGNRGATASPGGWLRVFGKCLSISPALAKRSGAKRTIVVLQGPRTLTLPAEADAYTARADLPKDLPAGEYQVYLHNGRGGDVAWSDPVAIRVEKPTVWPQDIFNVKDSGADSTGAKDDTVAVKAALAKSEANGGGIVYFPRGRYQISEALAIPRFTVLRGEKREWVSLFWPDTAAPPEALIRGTNSFGLEDLTLYASYHKHIIVSDLGDKPDSGNILLRRIRARADSYRGHLKPEEVDTRFKSTTSIFGGDSIQLGGDNIEITDCDIYGSGRSFLLGWARGAYVANNTFYNGRWGWYDIYNSEKIIFENNQIVGADLMSTGGGLSCWRTKRPYQQNIYFGHNTFRNMHGWDREAMTSDGGGGAYHGPVASATADSLTIPEGEKWHAPDVVGMTCFVVYGRGAGQWRTVASVAGNTLRMDRSWQVLPDQTSLICVVMTHRNYLLVGNDFADCGIGIQFYGTALNHIVAENRVARGGGFQSIGKQYGDYNVPAEKSPSHQPDWFVQFLDNRIEEGNIYRSGANNALLSADSVIGVFGWPPKGDWKWPMNFGAVVRRNHLNNNARIHIGGSQNALPSTKEVVVENNVVHNSNLGIEVDRGAAGVLVRGNRFEEVREPLAGSGLGNALIDAADRIEGELSRLRVVSRESGVSEDPVTWPEVKKEMESLRVASTDADRYAITCRMLMAAATEIVKRRGEQGLTMQTASSLLGLAMSPAQESTLSQVLQSGKGGEATLIMQVSANRLPAPVSAVLQADTPEGWKSEASSPVSLGPSKGEPLTMRLTVPPDTWGRQELPIALQVTLPDTTMKVRTSVSVGSGYLRDWMLIGPFENKTKAPLDLTFHEPEDGLNLQAEYEAKAGKVRWQPAHLRDNWLDLNAQFKSKEPGVAYAVACVQSERETPAVLRVGSSGGAALILNNQYLWSSNTTRAAAPNQDSIPVMLRSGDNVLLFKLSTVNDQWRFIVEVTPPPGGFTGKVQVVAPEQFASRAAFAPPPARPGETGSEVKYAAGVDWKLIYSDDFERDALGARWRVGNGSWKINGGILMNGGSVDFLAYAEALPLPVRIEYDTRVTGETGGDLSAFWLKDPASYGSGYMMGFGSNGNTCNKVMVDGAEVAHGERPLVAPGKWHHVIAQILSDGRVQLIVDDQLSINYQGTPPSVEPRFPGLWCWGTQGAFDKVRVFAAPK